MRVLRLFSRDEQKDFKVCYCSSNSQGMTLVNGVKGKIEATFPGYSPGGSQGWEIILSSGCDMPETGYFLSINQGESILRIECLDKKILDLSVVKPGFLSLSDECCLLRPLTTGILTVSDKGSRGEREDTSGPALEETVKGIACEVYKKKIIPDEKEEIKKVILSWCEKEDLDLILVTGGTGLSSRDVTPEALQSIAEKEVPGLGEYMRMQTSIITQRSILSRATAIVRSETLVIALPGSMKGSTQCFNAIAPVVRHAVEIIRGWTHECGHSH